jgi:amino acid adenylation domain-containing protein
MSTMTNYVLPPSYAQQRLWFAQQLDKTSSAYNIMRMIGIKGDLNEEALERSFNEVIGRHEVLRTSFEEEGGEPRQVIRAEARLEMKVEELPGSTPGQRRMQAVEAANREAARRFDLSKWPLMRVKLLKVDDREHVLLLVMHHIVSDGWSIGVLMRELGALYDAYSTGREASLAELEIQYADYAQWQRQWLESGELERQMTYWREQLDGAAPVLELPTDFARPALQGHRGESVEVELSRHVTAKLKQLSRREGATVFMSLLTALDLLLSRYCNQTDVVVGTPIANRTRAEVEGLIGFFANSLALRVEVREEESYRALLKTVREVALGAYANQDVPFEKVIEEMRPERDLSHHPLFQVMFSLHNQPMAELKLQDLQLEVLPSEYETSKFDLTLTLIENNGAIAGTVRYNTDLFKEETVRRMSRHFERLVQSIVEDPDSRVSRLDMMSPEEEHQILLEWNDTAVDCSSGLLVHELFEAMAAKNPDAIAVACDSEALTYDELNIRANRLAHFLREKGVGPEKVVGICMDRSTDLIVCELAVLKAGGAYLPIDPSYPPERVSYLLASSRAALLLTQRALLDGLKGSAPDAISLDSIRSDLARRVPLNPKADVISENLAYVIYTSGSTGRPKGVGITHAALSNLVTWTQQAYKVTCADRTTMLAGVSFDASVWEVWPYLAAGASIHIPDDQTRSDLGRFIRWLNEGSMTICFMPTPMAELAMAQCWPADMPLRIVHTGGEKLHWPSGAHYPFQLFNLYGPTENTVVATYIPVTHDVRGSSSPPIGRPISNVNLYVLNQSLRPVPIGANGKLYIGGRSLARGYIDQPDLTAERFIPNPYGEHAGEKLYWTGDVVRYLGEGNLEFSGRSDDQIKIRGYRIEPGEIEAALLDHPEVNTAAVIPFESPDGQKALIAYVVSRKQPSVLDTDSLKDHLRKRLAPYMIPAKFVSLETLPLTTNGKLDKRRLPAPEADTRDGSEETFLSQVEEGLAKLWAEILRLNRVGRQDNFFDIGGHSLAAMQLVAKVREQFGAELDIRSIFEEPTIPGLATLIAKKSGAPRAKPIEKMRRVDEGRVLAKLDQMSDENVEKLLEELLK